RADLIAALYKIRWQIELLFKQLKQNFPLKYFLGDNENAIKIQIYCVLIVNLLFAVIKKRLKRNWAFSNLVSFCKIHLFNYINLMRFLENPEKDWIIDKAEHSKLRAVTCNKGCSNKTKVSGNAYRGKKDFFDSFRIVLSKITDGVVVGSKRLQ